MKWKTLFCIWPKPLITGEMSDWCEMLMRRKINQKWQYRRITDLENYHAWLDQW